MKQRFRKPNVRQYWLVTKNRTSPPIVSPNVFAKLLMPFAIPKLLTFALVIFVGESRPRNTEAVPSPVSPSGSASLHLRPTLAMEASMH